MLREDNLLRHAKEFSYCYGTAPECQRTVCFPIQYGSRLSKAEVGMKVSYYGDFSKTEADKVGLNPQCPSMLKGIRDPEPLVSAVSGHRQESLMLDLPALILILKHQQLEAEPGTEWNVQHPH